MASLDEQKRALRAQLTRAERPSAEARAQAGLRAAVFALGLPQLTSARTVALYRALPSELPAEALAQRLEASGVSVVYPAVLASQRALVFRHGEGFARGPLGFEEPQGPEVAIAELDALVLPCRAVDATGGRLGRGAGHYDATLSLLRPAAFRLALVYEEQVLDAIPQDAHDQRVDAICTEVRLRLCPGGRR